MRRAFWLLSLSFLLAFSLVLAAGQGAAAIPWGKVVEIIWGALQGKNPPLPGWEAAAGIILKLRLPRVFLAALVGASLGVAGGILQALFRNPLADPYVTGVSSGASLGAAVALVFSLDFTLGGISTLPLLALLGALAALSLVYGLAQVGGSLPVVVLLLAGVVVGSCFSAAVSLLTYFAGERLHGVVFWLLGSLGGANWDQVFLILPYFSLGFFVSLYGAREMNALLFGEETALHLGVEVERTKKILLVTASLLTAAAVAVSGLIGFVGLISPHVVRLLVGPDHRFLIPGAAVFGATLLVLADTLARTLLAPTELPVGLITTLLGGPFFLYLLRRRRRAPYFGGD